MILDRVLILDIALLIGHQCDAAYWHEWNMFHLPGGIQLFNVLNVLIFLILLGCAVPVFQRKPIGYRCALFLAACSAIVLPIHSGFALAGRTEFHLPVSVFLIVASFLGAIALTVVTLRSKKEFL